MRYETISFIKHFSELNHLIEIKIYPNWLRALFGKKPTVKKFVGNIRWRVYPSFEQASYDEVEVLQKIRDENEFYESVNNQ